MQKVGKSVSEKGTWRAWSPLLSRFRQPVPKPDIAFRFNIFKWKRKESYQFYYHCHFSKRERVHEIELDNNIIEYCTLICNYEGVMTFSYNNWLSPEIYFDKISIFLSILENLKTSMLVGARNSAQKTTAHHPLQHLKRNSPVDQKSLRLKTHLWRKRRPWRLLNRKQWRLLRWRMRKMMMTKMTSFCFGVQLISVKLWITSFAFLNVYNNQHLKLWCKQTWKELVSCVNIHIFILLLPL